MHVGHKKNTDRIFSSTFNKLKCNESSVGEFDLFIHSTKEKHSPSPLKNPAALASRPLKILGTSCLDVFLCSECVLPVD